MTLFSELLLKRKLLLILLLTCSPNLFSQINQELVPNGSFETAQLPYGNPFESYPSQWFAAGFLDLYYYRSPNYVPSNQFGRQFALPLNSGQGYLLLENSDLAGTAGNWWTSARAGVQLLQPMEKGATYLIQAYVSRADNVDKRAEFKFQISRDRRYNSSESRWKPQNKITIGNGSVNNTHQPDDKEWKPIRFTYTHKDDNPFPYFYVKAKGESYTAFYLDNVSVQRVDQCGIQCCPEWEIFQKTSNLPAYTSTLDYIKAGAAVKPDEPTGNVIVQNGQNIGFQAANQITLYPGFHVQPGGEFKAKIAACSQSEFSVKITPTLNPCSHTLCATVCGSSTNYTLTWSNGLGSAQQIEVSPTEPTTYSVTVRDNTSGKTLTQSYTVIPEYFPGPITYEVFPNYFSPNGDGYNDVWHVRDYGKTTYAFGAYKYEFTVVDRWGRVRYDEDSETTIAPGFAEGDIQWDGIDQSTGRLVTDGIYYWWVKLYTCNGTQEFKGWLEVDAVLNSSSRITSEKIQESFELEDNLFDASPNPSSNFTIIKYTISTPGATKIYLTDITGKEVKVLTSNLKHPAGAFIHELDVSRMTAGTYFYTLQTEKNKFTKRLVVAK